MAKVPTIVEVRKNISKTSAFKYVVLEFKIGEDEEGVATGKWKCVAQFLEFDDAVEFAGVKRKKKRRMKGDHEQAPEGREADAGAEGMG